MKTNVRVTITYRKYGSDTIGTHTVDPYCLKIVGRRWYALVRHIEHKVHYMLCFDRIQIIELTDQPFTLDKDFYTPLLSRGHNIKVMEPQWLVEEINGQIAQMRKLYQ